MRETYSSNYYDQKDSIWYKASEIRRKENEMKRKPTKSDLKETKIMLSDFGYDNVVIPDLPTYNALIAWRKDYVVRMMDEEEERERKLR